MDKNGFELFEQVLPEAAAVFPSPHQYRDPVDQQNYNVRYVTVVTGQYPGIVLSNLQDAGLLESPYPATTPFNKSEGPEPEDSRSESDVPLALPRLRLMEGLGAAGCMTFEDVAYVPRRAEQ
jgi:hypothetical protein